MKHIAELIRRGAARLNDTELEALAQTVRQQPYCQVAHLLYAEALYLRQAPQYGEALRLSAISIPDRTALWNTIEGHRLTEKEKPLRKSNAIIDRTERLITGFLDTQPQDKPRTLTIADAATDYMAYLLQTEAAPVSKDDVPLSRQELIDDFIGKKEGHRVVLTEREDDEMLTPELQENDEFFTETMARIYIKQGKYDKALKIIERLSVKVPRKNAYFADQMRFLQLLIENNKYNNKQ